MNNNTYGINSETRGYIDTSTTLKGAKNHATRHGYKEVYVRYNHGYSVQLVAVKQGNKWINTYD